MESYQDMKGHDRYAGKRERRTGHRLADRLVVEARAARARGLNIKTEGGGQALASGHECELMRHSARVGW